MALAAECVSQGQRAFVGRVAMDHPFGTPAWYRDASASAGVDASARSIDGDPSWLDDGRDLVRPIVTPRFAPACTDATARRARRAGRGDRRSDVQTHCS